MKSSNGFAIIHSGKHLDLNELSEIRILQVEIGIGTKKLQNFCSLQFSKK